MLQTILLFISVLLLVVSLYGIKDVFIPKVTKVQKIEALNKESPAGFVFILSVLLTLLFMGLSLIFTLLACFYINSFIFTIISLVLFMIRSFFAIRYLGNYSTNLEKAVFGIPTTATNYFVQIAYLVFIIFVLYIHW